MTIADRLGLFVIIMAFLAFVGLFVYAVGAIFGIITAAFVALTIWVLMTCLTA